MVTQMTETAYLKTLRPEKTPQNQYKMLLTNQAGDWSTYQMDTRAYLKGVENMLTSVIELIEAPP